LVVVSAAALSFLTMRGRYVADAPLELPCQFMLILQDVTITVDPSFTGDAVIVVNSFSLVGVISLRGAAYASIVCPSGGPSPRGIYAINSDWFMLDGVSIDGCGKDAGTDGAGIHFTGSMSSNAVAFEMMNCVVANGGNGVLVSVGSRAFIHSNIVLNNTLYGVRFVAAKYSVMWANTVSGNTLDGVVVGSASLEVTLSSNYIGPDNRAG